MNQEFSLNCLILRPDVRDPLPVQILPSNTVSQLKDAIEKNMAPELDHIAAVKLGIYMVSDSAQYTHHR